MKNLSIGVDTSHERGQICLFNGDKVIENIFWQKKGSHSERLNQNFLEILNKHNFSVKEIQTIYCSIGPGSFTGLRVGINFCKTLAYSRSCPIYPINTLNVLAHQCDLEGKKVLSCIDAQKNSVFLSLFQKDSNGHFSILEENLVVEISKLSDFINEEVFNCGIGIDRYNSFISQELKDRLVTKTEWQLPDISVIISKHLRKNFLEPSEWSQIQPSYIKLSAPEEKLKEAGLKS